MLHGRRCDGADGQRALDRLVARLAGGGGPVQASVVDDPMVNAFTLPGRRVVVMRGLIAAAGDAPLIVASDRAMLAALTWRAKGLAVRVRAVPGPNGPVPSHYDMIYPLRGEPGPALWAGDRGTAPQCALHPRPLPAGRGELGERALETALLSRGCLDSLRRP